jgi:hypothetical protein
MFYRWMTSYKLHLEDTIDRMKKGQNIHGKLNRGSKGIIKRVCLLFVLSYL